MDHRKDFYKGNFTRNSPKIKRLNRERLAIRSKQRDDQFHATRKISTSPTPHAISLVAEENKENGICEVVPPTGARPKVISKARGGKLTRQELAVQRFIEWKEAKKARNELKKRLQKKPFVSAVRAVNTETFAAGALTNAASFSVPKFRAPDGLKNPAESVKPTYISNVKRRPSLYMIVPTPEKKKIESGVKLEKHSFARKVLLPGTTSETETITTAKTQQQKTPSAPNGRTKTVIEEQAKAQSTVTKLFKKATTGLSNTTPTATAPTKPEVQRFVKPRLPPPPPSLTAPVVKGTARIVKPIRGGGMEPPAIASTKPEVQRFVKPRPLILPPSTTAPVVKSSARIVKPIRGGGGVDKGGAVGGGGAVGKAKAIATLTTKSKAKDAAAITKPKLAVSMKAKTKIFAAGVDKKKIPAKIKLKKQTLFEEADPTNQPIAETPNDFNNNINHFGMFVTSTMRKSILNSQSTLEFLTLDKKSSDTISPVEPLQKVENKNSAAKRQLIPDKEVKQETAEALLESTLETVRYFRKQLKDETERLHAICDQWEVYKTEHLSLLQETGGDDMINVTIGQTKLLTSKKFMQFSGLIDRCELGATAPYLLVNDGSEKSKPITAIDLEGFWGVVVLQVEDVKKRFDNLERWRTNNWLDPDVVKPKQLAKAKRSQKAKLSPMSELKQWMLKIHTNALKDIAAGAADNDIAAAASSPNQQKHSHDFSRSATPQSGLKTPPSVAKGRKSILKTFSTAKRKSKNVNFNEKLGIKKFNFIIDSDEADEEGAKRMSAFKEQGKNANSPSRRRASMRNRMNSPLQQHLQKYCGEPNDLWMSALKGADQERRDAAKEKPKNANFNEDLPKKKYNFIIDSDEADEEKAKRMSASNEQGNNAKGRKSILKTPDAVKGNPKNVNFNEKLGIKKLNFIIDSDQSKEEKTKRMSTSNEQGNNETAEALVASTLETVRYFRKQLKDETERLHAICDQWEVYKTEHLSLLQETGGDDMINVTIGQTKLLTSKKFMQFSGLIDRCELGATAPHLLVNDGSEKSKPITAIDLEGFWGVVDLQVEDVKKRFDNLERWRSNNWLDPDVVKPKQLAKAKRSQKTKLSPMCELNRWMLKMQAKALKHRAAAAAAVANEETEVVETPHEITTQRIAKDRKVNSPAPSIRPYNSPNRRASMHTRANSPRQQHLRKYCGERNDLWMSALKGADQERRLHVMATPPPGLKTPPLVAKGRKSILKTPDTAKGKPKNGKFTEKLGIKKFNFIIDSEEADEKEAKRMSENEQENNEADTAARTYSLRTRNVILRPSGDFEIPK